MPLLTHFPRKLAPLVPAEKEGVKIIAVTVVFTALATTAVILRLLLRSYKGGLFIRTTFLSWFHGYIQIKELPSKGEDKIPMKLKSISKVFMAGYSSCAITGQFRALAV